LPRCGNFGHRAVKPKTIGTNETGRIGMSSIREADQLSWFEMPRAFVEPLVRFLRLGNTALDYAFYDVNTLTSELHSHGLSVVTDPEDGKILNGIDMAEALRTLDLDALSNPEGSILVVNAKGPSYVTPFNDVGNFLQHAKDGDPAIRTVSITGVGSSALGSVAFAWNISAALREPVAAIVPGYGVADVVQQALGGWFGFGMYNVWVKQLAQDLLARTAPNIAHIGRRLMKTAPGHEEASTGAPLFRRGNGSSDVLHTILKELPGIRRVLGHSKGALVIKNAINDLPSKTTERLHIVTFGCPIDEAAPKLAGCYQVLGLLDGLGCLNSWGNPPDKEIVSHHSTNTWLPLSMPVARLTRIAEGE
jgi:hypothetical protein